MLFLVLEATRRELQPIPVSPMITFTCLGWKMPKSLLLLWLYPKNPSGFPSKKPCCHNLPRIFRHQRDYAWQPFAPKTRGSVATYLLNAVDHLLSPYVYCSAVLDIQRSWGSPSFSRDSRFGFFGLFLKRLLPCQAYWIFGLWSYWMEDWFQGGSLFFFGCVVKTHLRINNSDLNHSSTGIPQDFPFPVRDLMDVSSVVVGSDLPGGFGHHAARDAWSSTAVMTTQLDFFWGWGCVPPSQEKRKQKKTETPEKHQKQNWFRSFNGLYTLDH